MAGVIFQTSFDHYTTITQRFNSALISVGTASIGAFGRNDTQGLRFAIPGGSESVMYVARTIGGISTIYVGMGLRLSNVPLSGGSVVKEAIFLLLRDTGLNQVYFSVLPTGAIRVNRGERTALTILDTTAFAILPNVYYHFSAKVVVSDTVGQVQIWINEVEVLDTGASIDTKATANSTINEVVLSGTNASAQAAGNAINLDIDDLVVRDDIQVLDREVGCYFVTGAGANTDWSPSGAATNHEAIDEAAPDGDTTHNATSTPGDKDTFEHEPCSATAEIDAVIPLMFVAKTAAGTAKVAPVVRHSGTDHTGADAAPSAGTYEYHAPEVFMENPGTSNPWTAAEFNAAELGYERTD